MDDMTTTLTERGQTSVPAAIRKQAGLAPGQALRWEFVSEHELRVVIREVAITPPNSVSMIGFARRVNPGLPPTTAAMLELLRAGETDV
jgi:bifunctional DNA-binding transcriptional regulator/antitoxin component of YhaV-PrlF toxin-antitoxin module